MSHNDSSSISGRGPLPATRGTRVAVVIPCYNDGELVGEAVASARACAEAEVVVVDDGSTDPGTRRALEGLAADSVRVVRQENAGLSAARMAGIRATSARYVYDLDADDLAAPEAITRMADLLDGDPAAAVCYGDYREFGEHELIRTVPDSIDPFRLAYTNEYPVTALFRRSELERVGGWRHLGAGYEDWNLWLVFAEEGLRGLHAGHGLITFHRRLHGERMLGVAKSRHRELYRALRGEHPRIFGRLRAHRRASSMSRLRKSAYPLVYGGRRRFRFERTLKRVLDRLGIWTLRG
jgi:glycosyltransferase involved in cell wall biosynthesis